MASRQASQHLTLLGKLDSVLFSLEDIELCYSCHGTGKEPTGIYHHPKTGFLTCHRFVPCHDCGGLQLPSFSDVLNMAEAGNKEKMNKNV
jgi:hypothetical protein